jgi:HSP20 family protein
MPFFNTLIPSSRRAAQPENGGSALGATIKPIYDLVEKKDAYGLTVYLPGVAKDGLEITADNSQFRIVGRRAWKQPEGWTLLYRESVEAPYELVLEHENAVESDTVHAELKDGVLRVSLPKAEALKPRTIPVS